jgi:hypothetical protein
MKPRPATIGSRVLDIEVGIGAVHLDLLTHLQEFNCDRCLEEFSEQAYHLRLKTFTLDDGAPE